MNYTVKLGVIDLPKEVIRLNNIIKENEEMSKNDTNKPSNDVERMRHIMKIHQSCIV